MKNFEKNRIWNLLYTSENEAENVTISEIAEAIGMSPTVAKLVYNRGYKTPNDAVAFLHNDMETLHDPFALRDMDKAVDRIRTAIEKGETVAIYGDYDVDGVTSVSLLYLYLASKGVDVGYYIPSRSSEGYGLSIGAIDKLKARGVELIITVDTGITATEEARYARECGIDMIVTDHHECRDELPEACAVVNPHRPDCTYPFKELAGVGVVFKLVCACEMSISRASGGRDIDAVRRICYEYADLAAIGTISDVMPICDENRLVVTLGLRMISESPRLGIAALVEASQAGNPSVKPVVGSNVVKKKRKITSGFIGFSIAPRINAAGRISSATKAVELVLADNEALAEALAQELCEINLQRQIEENRIAEQAYAKIEEEHDFSRDKVIVIDDDAWQQGIIGIVASRITEKYGLPSILISYDGSTSTEPNADDMGKGSGRSVKGMNLVEALNACEELLVKYGGHELAAGLTIKRGQVDAFRQKINEYAREKLGDGDVVVSVDADCELDMADMTMSLAIEIQKLEPFGVSNPTPSFVLKGAKLLKIMPMGAGKHTKLIVEKDGASMAAVWFGVSPTKMEFLPGEEVDLLFQLNINEYQGTRSLQMLVQDIKYSQEYAAAHKNERERYEQIKNGASFDESEDVVPTREDFASVYTLIRKEFRMGKTTFSDKTLLSLLGAGGSPMGYIKLKYIIRILQELKICGVSELSEGFYSFDVYFNANKTSIEKSAILKKLKGQCHAQTDTSRG